MSFNFSFWLSLRNTFIGLLAFSALCQSETLIVFDFEQDSLSTEKIELVMNDLYKHYMTIENFSAINKISLNNILNGKNILIRNCFGGCEKNGTKILKSWSPICGNIGKMSLTYSVSMVTLKPEIWNKIKIKNNSLFKNFYTLNNSGKSDSDGDGLIINGTSKAENISPKRQLNTNFNKLPIHFATEWQIDKIKNWSQKTGIDYESFISKLYNIKPNLLSKSQGNDLLMFIENVYKIF